METEAENLSDNENKKTECIKESTEDSDTSPNPVSDSVNGVESGGELEVTEGIEGEGEGEIYTGNNSTIDVSGRSSPPPLDSQEEDQRDTGLDKQIVNSESDSAINITDNKEENCEQKPETELLEQNENETEQNKTETEQSAIVDTMNESNENDEATTAESKGEEEQSLNENDESITQSPSITANSVHEHQDTQGDEPSSMEEKSIHEIVEEDQVEDIAVTVLPQQNTDSSSDGDHSNGNNSRHVHFSEEIRIHELKTERGSSSSTSSTRDTTNEVSSPGTPASPTSPSRESLPCVPQLSAQQLREGVVYQAQYLGSTPVIFSQNQKTVRMQQAREAVRLLKEAQDDTQPRIDVDLKINIKDLVMADRKTGTDLITHSLRTVSYVADIDNSLVIMAHRNPPSTPGTPLRLNCHIIETADPREVAMVIGQAFSTAYKEFLKSHGIQEDSLEKFEYQHVLSSQSKSFLEINSLADDNQTKEISFAKHKGDMLGLMLIDSGYGSAIPSCIVAHMNKSCAGSKSGLINVGDHILSVNGTSLVGMPLKLAIEQIKKCRNLNVVKMVTSSCPPVVDVTIMRPDLKFQLGFSVKDGNVCSLWRGSIAERSGVRVGHRIIEINGTSVVGLSHDEIVHMLSTTVGDIHIRTMPMIMYQLLTGQITPEYY